MYMLADVLLEPCRTSVGVVLIIVRLLLLICTGLFAVSVLATVNVLETETLPPRVTLPEAWASTPIMDVWPNAEVPVTPND